MTVPEQTPYIEHTGNGITTSFALGFQCETKDHLIVLIDDIEPPIATWSLTGGNVVFTTAPAAGKKITLQRNTPFSRNTDYQSYNNSFRPPAVNKDFDWIWWKLQELGVADWILGNRIDALKNYVDRKDDELKAYLMEEIRKQGVALDQLDEYYNYLMERLAQIAVDKGWDASFVVDGDKTQKQINDLQRLKNLVSITDFGAKPENDVSNAIQSALDTGLSIFIPEVPEGYEYWKVTRRMELKSIGQKVYGMGSKSLVKMVNALVCESVFRAADLGKNRFENVYAIPSVDGTLNWGGGVGFMIQRSHGSSVVNCEVSDHRGGGVSLLGSSYCYVSGNHIHDSVVIEDEEIGRWGNDITVNNGSFNIIDNNKCVNGCGIGIAVQNLVETDISNSNKITNNIVKDQPVYGIMLYKKAAADQILRNEIRNNTVENITGSIREPLGYAYGCGIYVQTAEHTLVHGNVIKDAMGRSKDGTTPHEIHTPAGIGIANVANATVTNNKVIDSGWYGIQAISSIALSARGAGIKISDNDVQGSNRIGIYVQDIPKTAISGNTVNQKAGSQAVLVRQNALSQSVFAIVSDNELYSDGVCFESSGGIKFVKLGDNKIEGTTAGYAVQLDGVRVEAVGNYIDPAVAAASGVRIGANVVTGLVDDNDIIKGNIGIGYASATTGNVFIGDKNRNNASIPFHNGTSQTMWRPLTNSGTPSVQGINLAIRNDAVNITGLTGAVRGQRVILKAGVDFKLVNSSTMRLSGAVDFNMVAGNLITLFNDDGVWREESRSLTA